MQEINREISEPNPSGPRKLFGSATLRELRDEVGMLPRNRDRAALSIAAIANGVLQTVEATSRDEVATGFKKIVAGTGLTAEAIIRGVARIRTQTAELTDDLKIARGEAQERARRDVLKVQDPSTILGLRRDR